LVLRQAHVQQEDLFQKIIRQKEIREEVGFIRFGSSLFGDAQEILCSCYLRLGEQNGYRRRCNIAKADWAVFS